MQEKQFELTNQLTTLQLYEICNVFFSTQSKPAAGVDFFGLKNELFGKKYAKLYY